MFKYEKIKNDEKLPIKLVRFLNECPEPVEKHWHNSIEIVVPVEGISIAWIDGEVIDINTEKMDSPVLIINSRSIHAFCNKNNTSYTGYALQINYQFLQTMCPKIDELYFIQPDQQISEEIRNEVYKIDKYYAHESQYKYILILESLYHILFIMLEKLSREKGHHIKNRSEKNKQRMTDIINYIDHHYQEDLSLEDISYYFSISTGHLSKMFRDNLNMTVKGYMMSVRFDKVREDLINTDLPLIDIAISNGFPNLKSLNLIFERNSGMTAAQYRRKIKKKVK